MTVLAALFVLLGGIAIGATSIGGVVVVPVLTALAGIPAERAVAAASFGFAFAGLAAFLSRPARPASDLSGAVGAVNGPAETIQVFGWPAVAAAASGAALGAATLAWLPTRAVALGVALLAMGSGAHALLARPAPEAAPRGGVNGPVAWVTLVALAFGVGTLSAWSGTGGPVVLLPLLALLRWPTVQAVEAAQRVQLPVAAAATTVNLWAGRLDLALGAIVGLLLLAGWLAGRALSRKLPVARLRQAVALALIATGVAYLQK